VACITSFPPRNKKECRQILSAVDEINPVIALMLEMMALTGLRYSDVSRLRFSDVMINGVFRDSIVVIQTKPFNKRIASGMKATLAKDRSKVIVYINEQAKELLEDALRLSGAKGLLFPSQAKPDSAYTAQYINRMLKAVAAKLKLNFALSTHSFRKSFALMLINNNAKIHQVRDSLGQSSLASTDAYLKTFMSESQELSNKISF
jgi:integrase